MARTRRNSPASRVVRNICSSLRRWDTLSCSLPMAHLVCPRLPQAKDGVNFQLVTRLVNSSAAGSLAELYVNRLRERDEITDGVGANKLIKAWPPANKEWTTKAVRDAFFSSPSLPRLLNPNAVRRTIADGVNNKRIAYAGKVGGGRYDPIVFEPESGLSEADIEVSDDMVILRAEDARLLIEPPRLTRLEVRPPTARLGPGETATF